MPRDYIPTREPELVSWSQSFASTLATGPVNYGVTDAQNTELQSLVSAFVTAYDLVQVPATRSKPNITDKNDKKKAMITGIRSLVRIIQASPVMTDVKREQLDIPVRDTTLTSVPVPSEMPVLRIISATPQLLELQVRNQEDKKSKPAGARSAWLYTYVGDTPPQDLREWTFYGGTTRSDPQMVLAGLTPGQQVWVTALWVNYRDQAGPACAPVMTRVNYSGLSEAA